jgi:Fic family protein
MNRMRALIRESNAIEGINDPKEVDQSLIAWDWLCDWNMPLTHGAICKVQKLITLNQDELQPHMRGHYRDMAKINVRVGNHYPPEYGFVPNLMDNWLLDYAELGPWEAHKRFEHIHPFVDGNGRTGRMLMWWQEIESGLKPTMIHAADRASYYARLQEPH